MACGSGTETRSAKEKKTQASAGALQAYAASPKAIMTLNYRVDAKMNSFALRKGEVTLELLQLSYPFLKVWLKIILAVLESFQFQ